MADVSKPVDLFYSYSHRDEDMRERLEKHLTILKRTGVVADWHDRRIVAGSEWKDEIDRHLETAKVILLLISSDFLASDYCWNIEMQRALTRHEAGEAVVIPILLHPVDWEGAPFMKLQALPRDARPVSKWSDPDEAFTEIAKGIRSMVRSLSERAAQTSTMPAGQPLIVEVWTTPALEAVADGSRQPAGSAAYRIGARIVVMFRANRDCYLTLVNLGTSGSLTILFPNAMHPANRIPADKLYQIPGPDDGFEYQLTGPPGIETLKAIVTLDDVPLLESQLAADGSLFRTVHATAAARDIAVIRKCVETLPASRMSEAEWQFQIV
jgi:Domain of unknown function (DUF4384)/TIR domain